VGPVCAGKCESNGAVALRSRLPVATFECSRLPLNGDLQWERS
jgi:hypothetical protein